MQNITHLRLNFRYPDLFGGLALVAALMANDLAVAATRTVHYAGMAVNDPLVAELSNWSFMTYCNLAVTNLSATQQRISKVEFMTYEFKTSSPTVVKSVESELAGALHGFRSWKGDLGTSSCLGTGTSLAPGEVCVMRYPVQTFTWSGKMAICSGKITTEDVDPTKPGSVIATGSLYLNQEAMVLGGQLSGAFYASQTHVQDEDFGTDKSLRPLPSMPSGYTFKHSQNMNVFCGVACRASSVDRGGSSWDQSDCDQHCGLGFHGTDTGNPSNPSHDNALMSPYPLAGGNGDNGWFHHISGWTMKTPKTAYKSQGIPERNGQSGINSSADADTPANSHAATQTMVQSLDRMQYHSVANGHFAGGMIYEMQIGAFNAICSAHNQYSKDGGLEFKHADGVDSHAVYDSNTGIPGAPPERLVCAHRHMKPDLFMRVGSTSPIVVNGGMPF